MSYKPVLLTFPIITEWLRLAGISGGQYPTLPFKQGHLQCIAQDHVLQAFECLQGERLDNFLGQLVPVLSQLYSKKMFLRFRGNLPCLILCPLPLILSVGATKKNLALPYFPPHCRYLQTLTNSPKAFSSPDCTVLALGAFSHM